jgi:hypothetical protein
MRPPPRPRRGVAFLAEGAPEFHRKRRTTNKRQSKVDEWLATRGSQCRAPTTPPPKRHNLPLGLGGGDGRIQSGAERKGWGCDYHEVDDDDDDDDDDGKGGEAKEKSINDSISEHKCRLTSNIIYSNTIHHTNK